MNDRDDGRAMEAKSTGYRGLEIPWDGMVWEPKAVRALEARQPGHGPQRQSLKWGPRQQAHQVERRAEAARQQVWQGADHGLEWTWPELDMARF